jgi:CubicO group peptidase (beta-lactamase class C family)
MKIETCPETVGFCSKRLANIHPWMQKYVDEGKLSGAITMVARHGQVVFCESLGYRDLKTRKPLKTDNIFRFYSMTKPVTSVAVMMLYEEGHFQLDDPVAKFIPGFRDVQVYVSGAGADMITESPRNPVTIHHLLTHTSGLTYGSENVGPIPELYEQSRTDFYTHDGRLADVVRSCKIVS